jgi:hypothetical protein
MFVVYPPPCLRTASEREREEYISLIEKCTSELDDVLKKNNSRVDEEKEY